MNAIELQLLDEFKCADAITAVSVSPKDESILAFGTEKGDVYVGSKK